MQTIDEVKAHCRDVGHGIEKAIAEGVDEIVGYAFDPEIRAALVEVFPEFYYT